MGLLDAFTTDPEQQRALTQGLLSAAFGAMAGRGSRLQAWGQGGLAGLQGYSGALDRAAQEKQQAAQMQRQALQDQLLKAQLADVQRQQQIAALPQQFVVPGAKPDTMDNRDVGQPGEQRIPQSFDQQGYLQALMGKDPMAAIQYAQAIQKQGPKLEKVSPGDTIGTFEGGKFNPVFSNPKAPDLPGPLQEYEYAKNQGYQGSFTQWDKERKQAGAASTNIKVENKTGESLAAQVGPMIAASHTAALGAQAAVVNADNITKALDSGMALTGPGATMRLRGAQIADALGVGGGNTAERIQKTREVIQGLAQSTMAARKQLAGQGQVSDNEGKLLERAASGDINDMTASEIRTVVAVNKRLAQRQIQIHNQLVAKTKANPATAPIANFFELPPQEQPQAAPGGNVVDFGSLK